MGSITENVLHSTKLISKAFDIKSNGKKLVKIVRDSDGKILTFAQPHTFTTAQIKTQFETVAHFTGTNGNGNLGSPLNVPFGTITTTPNTGLSNGDTITITPTYTGGNTGPATVTYTIPTGTFTSSTTDWTRAQIISEFNRGLHYDTVGGVNEVDSPIDMTGVTVTITPDSNLNVGDDLTFHVTAKAGNTFEGNPTGTFVYEIPAGAFMTLGHTWSNSQIIHQFEIARHFHGTNGNGNADAHITAPFGTINPTQTTGLSDGDVIQLRIGYTSGNSGPATVAYTIPAGTFTPFASTGSPSYTGHFIDTRAGYIETPKGTAAQKQAEFMRITTRVEPYEFYSQNGIGGISLPDVIFVGRNAFTSVTSNAPLSLPKVETIEHEAFYYIKITSLSLPSLKTTGPYAFDTTPLTTLTIPNALTIGIGSFESIVNAPTTQVTMPSLDKVAIDQPGDAWHIPATPGDHTRDNDKKDAIFGVGRWDKITFTFV